MTDPVEDPPRPSTIAEVASIARVSVGTVSNYLNQPEVVAEATRTRIAEAIDQVGWIPNIAVRTVRRGRSSLIGLVLSDVSNPFFTDVARGVEEAATAAGMTVILCNSDNSIEREDGYLRTLSEYRAAGILITPAGGAPDERYLELLRRQGSKLVLLAKPGPRTYPDLPWVGVDDVRGAKQVGEHLLEAGHERICFVRGSARSHHQAKERLEGLTVAVVEAGLDPASVIVEIETEGLHVSDGLAAAKDLCGIEESPRPTAVFAANDLIAVGLLRGLADAGIRVPRDIAVVGYDDLELAEFVTPSLTSVRQPRFELGRAAVDLLLAELDRGTQTHQEVLFIPELVVRASSSSGEPNSKQES